MTDIRVRSKSGGSNKVLLLTDGLNEALTGTLVYCVKSDASKEIKMRIIADVSLKYEID